MRVIHDLRTVPKRVCCGLPCPARLPLIAPEEGEARVSGRAADRAELGELAKAAPSETAAEALKGRGQIFRRFRCRCCLISGFRVP